jgi:hypothetical protein
MPPVYRKREVKLQHLFMDNPLVHLQRNGQFAGGRADRAQGPSARGAGPVPFVASPRFDIVSLQ